MTSPRERLALLILARRRALGLSQQQAARLADVSRGTWLGVETASRQTEDYMFAAVERVLRWQPGSIDAILAGGDPTPFAEPVPMRPADTRRPLTPEALDLAFQAIDGMDLPPARKLELIRRLFRARAPEPPPDPGDSPHRETA